jgi:decaprenylphospho-beta-D-erythro-pentofuranosid-2-ulose 2-reductase
VKAGNELARVAVFGATSGIAQETVRILAARGAALFLVGRDAARLDAVAGDAKVRGARDVAVAVADLNDARLHPALIAQAAAALGAIDAVLVAPGVLAESSACEADAALTEAMLLTNFVAPVLLCQAAALRLAEQGSGAVIAISSVAGDRGRASNYAYGATKAGLSTFLDGLRHRMWRRGVQIVTVKPGFVDTPMTAAVPKNALFAHPSVVARAIVRAVERRQDVVYVPRFWRGIMLVIRWLPAAIFKRLPL